MSVVMYHQASGKTVPRPATMGEMVALQRQGFQQSEELVETRSGHRLYFSCEPSVNSGQGVVQALSAKRADLEDAPAFMRPEAWVKLPDTERARLLVKSERPQAQPAAPATDLAALQAELAALRAQLAQQAAPAPRGK